MLGPEPDTEATAGNGTPASTVLIHSSRWWALRNEPHEVQKAWIGPWGKGRDGPEKLDARTLEAEGSPKPFVKAGTFKASPRGWEEGNFWTQGSVFMQRNSICEGPEVGSNSASERNKKPGMAFPVKGQIVNILFFAGHTVSVATIHRCHECHEWARLCSPNSLLTKTGSWPDLAHRP